MTYFLLAINFVIGSFMLGFSLYMINKMSKDTSHLLRVAYIILAAGSFSIAAGFLYGYTKPQWAEVIYNAGAAIALIEMWREREKKNIKTKDGSAL